MIDKQEEDHLGEFQQLVAREAKRLASRPDIDHLDDAVEVINGERKFVQNPGQRVIIERVATCLSGSPWLDTRSYIVVRVDQSTGYMKLLDEEMRHHASCNFITGLDAGYRFKVPARGIKALPRQRKTQQTAAPGEKAPKTTEPKKEKVAEEKLRRVYATRGVIHTRIKGLAYRPEGTTQATGQDRLIMNMEGKNLVVKHPTNGWTERWVPDESI